MIKFIRLLFYHIYFYFYKTDNENNSLAKFTTFLTFLLIFSLFISSFCDVIFQNYDESYTTLPGNIYIFIYIFIGLPLAFFLYTEKFHEFREYDKKYYYYFFIIMIITLCLVIYSGKISRERIFKQRVLDKEQIERNDRF